MEIINPQLKEVLQKQEEFQIKMARIEGGLEELRRIARDTTRQTIWQFVIFAVTMIATVLGVAKFQTDSLRNEINSLRSEMSVRSEATRNQIKQSEKNISARFDDLKQEVRADRKK